MSDADVWVSAEFQRLAEIINDYDQYLFLEEIPNHVRETINDKKMAFRIVDDRNKKVVLYADSLSNPADILARLWSMDSARGNVLSRLDARNAAVEALKLKEELERREALIDFSAFILKNTKSRWVHDGRVRDEEFRDLGAVRTHIT